MAVLILGGTFNPVHSGHVRLALEALEATGCERLLWLPSYAPPHRPAETLLPFALRSEMLQAASAGIPRFEISDIESRQDGPSFSYEVLRRLLAEGTVGDAFFTVGMEQFLQLGAWHRGLDLPDLANLVVAARDGLEAPAFDRAVADYWPAGRAIEPPLGMLAAYLTGQGRQVLLLAMPRLDISSSQIRRRWLAGRSIHQLVPDGVLALIERHRDLVKARWGRAG